MADSPEKAFAERERDRILDRYPKDAWLQEHVRMLYSSAYTAGGVDMAQVKNDRHGLWRD